MIELQTPSLAKLLASLDQKKLKGRTVVDVEVGYSAPHALLVHEDLEARHEPPTQAKYLEQPARELADTMRDAVEASLREEKDVEKAVLVAANMLFEASQAIVPEDTGELKASGYVKVVK